MSGSPLPKYVVLEADLGRGPKFYIYDEREPPWHPRGGPFASREEAQAEVDRRYEAMQALYDAVNGPGVCWSPEP